MRRSRSCATSCGRSRSKITGYAEEMNAEEVGRRLNPTSSGRAGPARAIRSRSSRGRSTTRNAPSASASSTQLAAKREELRAAQGRIAADAAARRNQAREAVQDKRDALEAQVDVARRELAALEASRLAKVAEFRTQALAASDFQKLKDDPLSRMTAYQELKNDPKDGATITLFSWMTKFLVIFLEIVPVVAKMFFSPPSVYAARIQAMVNRGREEAFRSPPPQPALEPEPSAPLLDLSHLGRAAGRKAEARDAAGGENRDARPQKPGRTQGRPNRSGRTRLRRSCGPGQRPDRRPSHRQAAGRRTQKALPSSSSPSLCEATRFRPRSPSRCRTTSPRSLEAVELSFRGRAEGASPESITLSFVRRFARRSTIPNSRFAASGMTVIFAKVSTGRA